MKKTTSVKLISVSLVAGTSHPGHVGPAYVESRPLMTVCEQGWERTEGKLPCVLRGVLILLNDEAEPSPSQMLGGSQLFKSILAILSSYSAFSAASYYLFWLTKW